MSIAFRVDASCQIGTGHVMRCLTLAKELQSRNKDVYFICRGLEGNLAGYIEENGFHCDLLCDVKDEFKINDDSPSHSKWLGVSWRQDAEETSQILKNNTTEWLVVDHYGLDYRWHREIREHVNNIFVIDDLADRDLDCDILLDQNFYLNPEQRYLEHVANTCRLLLGPRYALLRQEFASKSLIKECNTRKKVDKVFVFMGGADPTGETEKTLLALDRAKNYKFKVDVVVSSVNPRADVIRNMCEDRDYIEFHQDISNISQLMSMADLAIGAGGATTLERCYLGLPSLVIMVAENQIETTTALNDVGALESIGWHMDVSQDTILNGVSGFLSEQSRLEKMCKNATRVFGEDGFVGVSGVVSEMLAKEY